MGDEPVANSEVGPLDGTIGPVIGRTVQDLFVFWGWHPGIDPSKDVADLGFRQRSSFIDRGHPGIGIGRLNALDELAFGRVGDIDDRAFVRPAVDAFGGIQSQSSLAAQRAMAGDALQIQQGPDSIAIERFIDLVTLAERLFPCGEWPIERKGAGRGTMRRDGDGLFAE